jgi:hypothetical protein
MTNPMNKAIKHNVGTSSQRKVFKTIRIHRFCLGFFFFEGLDDFGDFGGLDGLDSFVGPDESEALAG